jgi:hypothetical protein
MTKNFGFWILPGLCALGLADQGLSPAYAETTTFLLSQGKPGRGPIPPQKLYIGLDSDPEACDTRDARGWFYWYRDAAGQCYILPASSREEAERLSREIVTDSFHVIVSGYGLRDSVGNPLE